MALLNDYTLGGKIKLICKYMCLKTAVYILILVLYTIKTEGGIAKPYLGIITGYDDNITLQPTTQKKDIVFSLMPGIRFKTGDKILVKNFELQGKYIAYRKYTEHNRTECLIRNTIEWRPAPYEFLLTGEYLKGEEIGEEILISMNKYSRMRFSNTSRYKTGKIAFAEISYNMEKLDWQGLDIDSERQAWGLRIQPTTIFGAKYQDIIRKFEDKTKFSQKITSLIFNYRLNKSISTELEVGVEDVSGREKDVCRHTTLLFENPVYSLTLNHKSGYTLPESIQAVEDRKSFEIKTRYRINRNNSIEAYWTDIDRKFGGANNEQINEIKGIFTHQIGRDILCRVMSSYWKQKPDFTKRRVLSVSFIIGG